MAEGMPCIGTYSTSYGNDRVFFVSKVGDNFAFALVSEEPSHDYKTWHMGTLEIREYLSLV
jgi:hypothetical protein